MPKATWSTSRWSRPYSFWAHVFFGEVQTGSSKIGGRTKTYDVNYVDEGEGDHDEDEQVFMAHEMSEDAIMESFLAEGDEDALVIQQFEDAVIESLQNDPEVAVCLNSYADARRRLQDKSKGRGFWAPRPGKSKGKGKFKGSFKNKFRKPLAQRILESFLQSMWSSRTLESRMSEQSQVSSSECIWCQRFRWCLNAPRVHHWRCCGCRRSRWTAGECRGLHDGGHCPKTKRGVPARE